MTKTLLETKRYNMFLYRKMLEEIEMREDTAFMTFPKWKRDILLILLCRAKPDVKRKYLRKKVSLDLDKIMDRALKEMEELGMVDGHDRPEDA